MKYPRSWLKVLEGWCFVPGYKDSEKLLDELSAVGALKETPKPREFRILLYSNGFICAADGNEGWYLKQDTKPEVLVVREVEEE